MLYSSCSQQSMKTFQFTSLWNMWSKLKDSPNSASNFGVCPQAQKHPLIFVLLACAGISNVTMIETKQITRCIAMIARISASVLLLRGSNVFFILQCWVRKIFSSCVACLGLWRFLSNILFEWILPQKYGEKG